MTSEEFIDFSSFQFWGSSLFKMSQFLDLWTSPALTPYYSYRASEICSTSHWELTSRPAAGNTCVSMENLRILCPKPLQNDRFSSKFWKCSGSRHMVSNDLKWCFLMSWRSLDHRRLILDRFGITYFFMKISQKMTLLMWRCMLSPTQNQ